MNIVASLVLVRCLKRRTLFILSELLSCASMMVLGGYFFIRDHDKDLAATLGWLPLVSLVSYIGAVAMGVAPLAWLMSNEILPPKFKGPGSSIVGATYWISAFTVTKTFVDLGRAVTTAGTFWFYGCVCAVGILFGIFILPETKGKTSEEIQSMFSTLRNDQVPSTLTVLSAVKK
jgi:facilitated trehalose transporter